MLGADLFSQQARIKREELEGKIHDAHMRGELDTVAMYRNQLAKVPLDSEIDFAYTKERPETKLYQRYLERMRDTGQTNLNLDVVDLLAFRWRETQQGGVIRNREDREYAQLYRNFCSTRKNSSRFSISNSRTPRSSGLAPRRTSVRARRGSRTSSVRVRCTALSSRSARMPTRHASTCAT
jgi:hypothetical protein